MRAGGLATLGGVAVFAVIAIALHVAQPGYDPSTQLMSELALGRYGGAMLFAFAALAVAMLGVQASVAALGAHKALRAVLLVAAALFLAAGLFPLGDASSIHIAAIAAAFVLSVLAMYLFPAMAEQAAGWAPRSVSWGLAAGVAASVLLGHTVVPMGIGQRSAAAFLLAWLAVVGWRAARELRDSI